MSKHILPVGQIFSYDAQTSGQENLPRVEKKNGDKKYPDSQEQTWSSIPTYIFRLEKLVCGEGKGFLGFIFVLLSLIFHTVGCLHSV